MTEDELQELRNYIVEACDRAVEEYDWDKAFQKYLEAQ